MIGTAFAFAFAAWFFTAARSVGKNAWLWAGIGFVCFLGTFTILSKVIIFPLSLFIPVVQSDDTLHFLVWMFVAVVSAMVVAFIRITFLKNNG